jgi:bifunctional non-homologous end joining protein LigD
MPVRISFIPPLSPSASVRRRRATIGCPNPKWEGFRFQVIKDGAGVCFYSKSGADYTARLPRMAEAFAKLSAKSAILDGELALIDRRGARPLLQAHARDAHATAGRDAANVSRLFAL